MELDLFVWLNWRRWLFSLVDNALYKVRFNALYTLLPAVRILKIKYEDKRNIFGGLFGTNA
jgi:hypothetical protein